MCKQAASDTCHSIQQAATYLQKTTNEVISIDIMSLWLKNAVVFKSQTKSPSGSLVCFELKLALTR